MGGARSLEQTGHGQSQQLPCECAVPPPLAKARFFDFGRKEVPDGN